MTVKDLLSYNIEITNLAGYDKYIFKSNFTGYYCINKLKTSYLRKNLGVYHSVLLCQFGKKRFEKRFLEKNL